MKKFKQVFAALTCIIALAAAAHYTSRRVEPPSKQIVPVESESSELKAEKYLNSLLPTGPAISYCPAYDPSKEPARKERAWKLYQLWLARHERDVTEDVLPFLQDEYGLLRNTAARLLGRLENRDAEHFLPMNRACHLIKSCNSQNKFVLCVSKAGEVKARARRLLKK